MHAAAVAARAQLRSAQQQVAQAEANRVHAEGQLQQALTAPQQVAVSQANQKTANAQVRAAQAALDNARIVLQRTRIVAPVAGTIGQKNAEVGQQVSVGQPIMAVVPNNDAWVLANFQETQLKGVRPGQRAEVRADAIPGRTFTGRVQSLAPATGATFALLPPNNATGNFTKVVQRVPVKIVFDPNQKDLNRLRGGLSVTATIALR